MRSSRYRGCGRRRGLTRVEVVVIVAVLAFLFVGLLIPSLRRHRSMAFHPTCQSNLAGLGKAMLLYAADYGNELPRAGGRNSNWAPVNWNAPTRQDAYAMTGTDGTGGNCTISSCFYLLVKYAEVTPKSFLCTNERDVREFQLGDASANGGVTDLTQAWDLGPNPASHCSYTYHAPWGPNSLTTAGPPGFALMADRNPWQAAPSFEAKTFPASPDGKRRFQGKAGRRKDQEYGNTSIHTEDGQNVVFLDGHVSFEKRPYCGLDGDNIYTVSTVPDKGDPLGIAPKPTVAGATPRNRRDSVLVHDPLT
jgi:prepilin-type processing-associated H-X9-DG protein